MALTCPIYLCGIKYKKDCNDAHFTRSQLTVLGSKFNCEKIATKLHAAAAQVGLG